MSNETDSVTETKDISETGPKPKHNENIIKELRRDANVCGILLLLFFVIEFSATAALRFFGRHVLTDLSDQSKQNILTFILYLIMYPIGMPIIFLVFRKISKKYKDQRIKDLFKKPQMPAGWVVKWIIITIGICYLTTYISNILFLLLQSLFKTELKPAEFNTDTTSPISVLTYVLALPFFAPIFEELFFRGTIYRNVRKYGPWSMILICGTIFGLWHLNYQQMVYASVMGILACYVFEKTQSIIPTMIVHFTVNSIGLCQLFILSGLDMDKIQNGDISGLLSSPIKLLLLLFVGMVIISLIITAVILLIIELVSSKARSELKTEYKCKEITGGKSFITFITSPVMAVALLFMIGMTVYYAVCGR